MNLAHELHSPHEGDPPEPEPRTHRRPFRAPWRPEAERVGKDVTPEWAKDPTLLPKKPPVRR